jgi:ribosomal protein S18 acetylase RimI-like enzyme
MSAVDVVPLRYAQIRVTAEALARAFDDSPIVCYLIPKDRPRVVGLRALFIAGLVDAYKHGEAWVATVDESVVGAGVWLPPGAFPPSSGRQFRQLLHLLAVAPVAPLALPRSLRYLRRVEAAHPTDEHWYLATLGVDPQHQGEGHGGRLLDAVLGKVDEIGLPAYLETDKERNLAYYQRFGFAERDQLFPAKDAPPTWTMWREPR